MMKPRWLARLLAWIFRYSWRRCPICQEYCSGNELARGIPGTYVYPLMQIEYMIKDDAHHIMCCRKIECIKTAQRSNYSLMSTEFAEIMETGGSHYL